MKRYLLFLIVILATILRLWNLDNNPNGLHADEADTGYTAYSILHTGKDHYTDIFTPFFFRGQSAIYRAPIYTYLTIPSIALFGLNEFGVRFPSAILGVGFVLCIFFLTKKIVRNEGAALFAAFLAAINPWSIHVSRTGLEIGSTVFFITCGVTFFLYAIDSKKKLYLLIFSALFFSLSVFTYHSAKIFAPFLVTLLCWYAYKHKITLKNLYVIIFIIIFWGFYSIMLYENVINKGGTEYYNVSILNNSLAQKSVDRGRTLTIASLSQSSIFHNKLLYYINSFQFHYLEPLSINYLFLNGESSLDKGVSNHGQFYLFELPLFFLGWYILWRKSKSLFTLLLGWFLFALIPGAITVNGYYAYRDIQLLPVPILISSIAISEFYQKLKKKKSFILYFIIVVTVIFFSIINYINIYFFDYYVYSRDWWGYSQWNAIKYLDKNDDGYDSVYIHGGEDWLVIFAFYHRLDPDFFRNAFKNRKIIDGKIETKIGKYVFGDLIDDNRQQISSHIKKNSLFLVPGDVYTLIKPKAIFRDVENVHIIYNILEVK